MPTITQLKKSYSNDPDYKRQVDDTVKKSKSLYGVHLTKEDVFKAVSSGGFIDDYAKKKKAAKKTKKK